MPPPPPPPPPCSDHSQCGPTPSSFQPSATLHSCTPPPGDHSDAPPLHPPPLSLSIWTHLSGSLEDLFNPEEGAEMSGVKRGAHSARTNLMAGALTRSRESVRLCYTRRGNVCCVWLEGVFIPMCVCVCVCMRMSVYVCVCVCVSV